MAMNEFEAVFNGHCNNAHRRALAKMRRERPGSSSKVVAIAKEGGGIMAIFDRPPTEETRRYVSLVTQFVNEPRP